MGEKNVARKSDLESHIQSPSQTVHGIFAIVKTKIASMIAAAVGLLAWRNSGYMAKPFFQTGYIEAGVTTVTFPVAYAAAPNVFVQGVGNNAENVTTTILSISASQFTTIGKSDGNVTSDQPFLWISIGEKA